VWGTICEGGVLQMRGNGAGEGGLMPAWGGVGLVWYDALGLGNVCCLGGIYPGRMDTGAAWEGLGCGGSHLVKRCILWGCGVSGLSVGWGSSWGVTCGEGGCPRPGAAWPPCRP
jgi:hypothetical protein